MCRPSGADAPRATSSSPTTTWMTTVACASRSSGQNTIEARAYLRGHPIAPHTAATRLVASTATPTAARKPLSGCPSALCGTAEQGCVIPPGWHAEELPASARLPASWNRERHGLHVRQQRAGAEAPDRREARAL